MKFSRSAVTKVQAAVMAVIIIVAVMAVVAYYVTRIPTPTLEQILVIGTTATVDTFDPPQGFSWPSWLVCYNLVVEGLTQWKTPETVEVVPWLATSWTVSTDGKTFDFYLREGVKFHDGTDFTAQSVKKALERSMNYMMGQIYLMNVESVEVVDTYHVRINLKTPHPAGLPKILGMANGFGAYSADAAEEAGEEWGKTVLVATGPFKFVEWVPGEKVVLTRNEEYWGPKPKLEKIIIKLFADPTTARMALEKGEIDMFYKYALATDIPVLKANLDIEYQEGLFEYVRFLTLNRKFPPLDNKLVRQAIAYAIDVEGVLEVGYKGNGELIYSMVNSWLEPYYKKVFEKYEHDPEKARELLAEAGYPDGFDIDLYYTPTHYDVMDKDVALLIQNDLNKVGIKVAVRMEEWATFAEKYYGAELPMALGGWTICYADPEEALMASLHSDFGYITPVVQWQNPRFDELGYLSMAEKDLAKRKEYYHEAQDILGEEVPVYTLKEGYRYVFYRGWVKNFTMYNNVCADDLSFLYTYMEP